MMPAVIVAVIAAMIAPVIMASVVVSVVSTGVTGVVVTGVVVTGVVVVVAVTVIPHEEPQVCHTCATRRTPEVTCTAHSFLETKQATGKVLLQW